MKTLSFVAVAALALPGLAHAENSTFKPLVAVTCTNQTGDTTGALLCTALRDNIARSPRYRLADTSEKQMHFTIRLMSLEVNENQGVSAAGVAFTLDDPKTAIFMNNGVFVTGSEKATEQAAAIMAHFDTDIDSLK